MTFIQQHIGLPKLQPHTISINNNHNMESELIQKLRDVANNLSESPEVRIALIIYLIDQFYKSR